MSLNQLLSHWRAEPTIYTNIAEWRTLPARLAQYKPIPNGVHPRLASAIRNRGIKELYIHQHVTWELSRDGHNVIIVTGTASGKTLAYNLPILDSMLTNNNSKSLFIFPTKALAYDQFHELKELISDITQAGKLNQKSYSGQSHLLEVSIPIGVYDGDTKPGDRTIIRKRARILLTNPDMLHMGILPHHTRWANFFSELEFIVIDEIHIYRGIFGSHVANVIRRLRRIANFYGSRPRFFLTSATIANPIELGEKLIEEPVELVDEDGSSQGSRHFLIYNPPIIDDELGLRRSSLLECERLVSDLSQYNIQTIVFSRSRRSVEILLTYLKQNLSSNHHRIKNGQIEPREDIHIVRGYRSGYLPVERRAIEEGLRSGEVQIVVATNALELGIDIGAMGASVMNGYPGTIASTWQQAGRAGRSEKPSLVILVSTASPLDQFLAHNPDYFFERTPENALINPDNLLVLLTHMRCALFELPFTQGEIFGNLSSNELIEFMEIFIQQGIAHQSGNKYFWMSDNYPAERISLRVASQQRILLQTIRGDDSITIGEVDIESANWLVHPNAIYLQESQMYLVEELNLEGGIAILQPTSADYYTVPKTNTSIELINLSTEMGVPGGVKAYGEILVTTQVSGFRQVRWFTHEQLGFGELDLPPNELNTMGYWISLDENTIEILRSEGLWTNDPNQYGPSWSRQKNLARERDGYRCQVCGVEELDRAHDVHHKTPFRQFDSPQLANQLTNLITLCPSCHHRVESSVRLHSGLSGLAYILDNIAPMYLMCDPRDLGVYFDPKSTLANGNPAVVIYERIPAGIGFSQRLFELHASLCKNAIALINNCQCADGCPSCVGPAGENGVGGKQETLALLSLLID